MPPSGDANVAKVSGRNKTPRKAVMIPSDWVEVAKRMAAKRGPSPTVWYLVKLIEADARAAGETTFPRYPWDEPETKPGRPKKRD